MLEWCIKCYGECVMVVGKAAMARRKAVTYGVINEELW